MRLAQLLFKPKWQDKDAAVRRNAVATGDDAELIAALPLLVREDADAGVRLAALKRLNDYEQWRERSTGDADGAIRAGARSAYLALLCANASAPSLTRRIAELDTLAPAELEKVATTAAQRDLRAAALERIDRPGLLAERATADPDAQLRLAALERIDDPGLLERIAQRTRKTDKAVSRRARERLESSRISAGDGAAIADRARVLCERAESLVRAPRIDMEKDLVSVDTAWTALGAAIPAEILARYRGTHALALRALDSLQNPQIANVPEPVTDHAESVPQPVPIQAPPQAAVSEVLVSQARFDAALAAAQAEARVERERRKALQHDIELLLPAFASAIDDGDSTAAHRVHASIHVGLKSFRDVPADLQQHLLPLEARHAEMKRWQHWSNNQRRRALCADIEALAGSGLHPDALATRVREAREEWQRLDAAEGIAADSDTGPGISRRFHALCHQALRPTKVYFSKRKEVRKSHGDEIQALLARAAAVADDCVDWSLLATLRTEASGALRALDDVDPRTRMTLAKRLKDAIARISSVIETHAREVQTSKQRLIELAGALSGRGDQAALPREVRDLQKRWTALGNGRRAVDQRQWREFRAACDAVFGKLDAVRKDREAQTAAAHAQVQDVLTELEALAADEIEPTESVKAKLRDLDTRWQAAASDDRAFTQRQRQARDAVAARLKDATRRQRLSRYTVAMRKYIFIRSVESGVLQSADRWDGFEASTAQLEAALQVRYAIAQSPAPVEESESAREILVELEALAGVDSPAEDRQRRMNHQVRRLSARMRSGISADAERGLDDLLAAWFAQAAQTQTLEDRFERSATATIDALP
jgi:DNA repair protein SbcC/Rad50